MTIYNLWIHNTSWLYGRQGVAICLTETPWLNCFFVKLVCISLSIRARSQYWAMLGRLGFSLFQLKLSIIYTDNFCLVSLSYVERDNKKRKQNMFPFDFFVIDHFVANFDQKMLEKRDIEKNIFSMAFMHEFQFFFLLQIRSESIKITCKPVRFGPKMVPPTQHTN